MFFCGYRNEIEPLCWSFERFAIFLLWVVSFSHLGPIWAYVRVFWCPTTLQNPPVELKPWLYVLLWGREQKISFVSDLWAICDFSPVSGHFCHFGLVWAYFRVFLGPTTPLNPPTQLKFLVYVVVLVREKIEPPYWSFDQFASFFLWVVSFCHFGPTYPPTPPHSPNRMIRLRFVANPFATFSPKVTSRKPNLNEEFGSFLFFIFSISLKWGSFWSFSGPILCYFEVL